MSIKQMSLVWEHAPVSGNELLLLLALADFADDRGRAGASTPTLARKTRSDERTVRRVLARLRAAGLLDTVRSKGVGNRYRIRSDRFSTGLSTGAADPGQFVRGTPGKVPALPGQIARGAPDSLPGVKSPGAPLAATSRPAQTRPSHASAQAYAYAPSEVLLQDTTDVCALENENSPTRQAHTHAEATRIIDAWHATFPAARGQARRKVLTAVTDVLINGIEPDVLAGALARLTADGFVVTEQTLAVGISQVLAEQSKRAPAAANRRTVADAVATPDVNPDDVGAYLAALRNHDNSRNGGTKEGH